MTRHVLPTETRPARLAALPRLPLFVDLTGRRVVIAGGGEAVAWKAELMASAGASVTLLAPEICPELSYLVDSRSGIDHIARDWRPADLDHAWVAIGDCGSADDAAEFAAAARARGVLVNVIDQPDYCDFQFGTIVNRAPVVVGISTDGAAPILGQAIRRRIEAVLPASLGGWAAAAKRFRGRLKEIIPERAARRRFWEGFVDLSFISQAEEDERLAELEQLAKRILEDGEKPPVGEVVIVGAGPGDPELITMKGMRELQAADVILYDSLVTPEVLELGRREARRILVGKRGHVSACRQEAINEQLVTLASEGHRVVRLKGGDPALFGRSGEELAACRAAGIPVRIVPGVTTASAAAAALGISLTHRDCARRVQFVTGHDQHGGLPDDLDIAALADPRATTVVYMGRRTIGELALRLVAAGLPGTTPVAMLANVSRRDENRTQSTLADLAGLPIVAPSDPTIIVIGEALGASTIP